MPATEKGSVCPGKNKPVLCGRKPSAEADISIPSAARELQSGAALQLGAAGVERQLLPAEAAAAAAFPAWSHLLPAPGQPWARLSAGRELPPGRAAPHPALHLSGTRRPPAGLAPRLQTSAAASQLQPEPPGDGAPAACGHQPPPAAFPHRAPDSVQGHLPAPLVRGGLARRLRGVPAEPHQAQPVPLHVRAQRSARGDTRAVPSILAMAQREKLLFFFSF